MESCFTNHQDPLDPLPYESLLAKPAAFLRIPGRGADQMSFNPQALATLYESEESPLLYYAIGIVRRRIVAEEIVQEAFLRLQKVEEQVENPRGWLYRSVRNLALNHLRDSREETNLDPEVTLAEENLPSDVLARSEAIGTVRMLLAEMPEDDRALIKLKYNDDLKYQEISKRTGMTVGNVGFRLHHVLKGLLDGLQRAGIDGSQG
jgi:RNA polymerase sigma factor (sigma-70 family)